MSPPAQSTTVLSQMIISNGKSGEQNDMGEDRYPEAWKPFLTGQQTPGEPSSGGDTTTPDCTPSALKAYLEFGKGELGVSVTAPSQSTIPSASSAHVQEMIEDVNARIHRLILPHQDEAFHRLGRLKEVHQELTRLNASRSALSLEYTRIRSKWHEPFDQAKQLTRKQNLVYALNDVLRSVLLLENSIRRFHTLMLSKEYPNSSACLMEIELILEDESLQGIHYATEQRVNVTTYKADMMKRAQECVNSGLKTTNQTLLSQGIAILFHLKTLEGEMRDLTLAPELLNLIQRVFRTPDSEKVANKSEAAQQQPTNTPRKGSLTPLNEAAFWKEVEKLMDIFYEAVTRIVRISRVLAHMKDLLGDQFPVPAFMTAFWKNLIAGLEQEFKIAVKKSSTIALICQSNYAKLLSHFHVFWDRITTFGLEPSRFFDQHILFKALSIFEPAYLIKTNSRLAEPLLLLGQDGAAQSQDAPKRDVVEKLYRAFSSELDIAGCDMRLFAQVAKLVEKTAIQFCSRICRSLAKEPQSITGVGPIFASQLSSIEVGNSLYLLKELCWKGFNELEIGKEADCLFSAIDVIHQHMIQSVQVVFISITQELESVLLKMHKEDFTVFQPAAVAESSASSTKNNNSPYLSEFSAKLKWIHREFLVKLTCEAESLGWQRKIADRIIDFFQRHISFVSPLSEQGKLKIAADITQFEFVVSQWLTSLKADQSRSFAVLRALKVLLFADPLTMYEEKGRRAQIDVIPPTYLAHMLLVAGAPDLKLPHDLFHWSPGAYSEWLDTHTDAEAMVLVERCVTEYKEMVDKKGGQEYAPVSVVIERLIVEVRKGSSMSSF